MPEAFPEEPIAGFNQPIVPQDPWVAGLYERHDLGETPSLADIEPVAKELLRELGSSQTALEMALGRRIDSLEMLQDERLRPLLGVFMSNASIEEKFGCILMAASSSEPEPET